MFAPSLPSGYAPGARGAFSNRMRTDASPGRVNSCVVASPLPQKVQRRVGNRRRGARESRFLRALVLIVELVASHMLSVTPRRMQRCGLVSCLLSSVLSPLAFSLHDKVPKTS